MFLETSQDLILLVGAICLLLVTGFVCWLLYEAARLLHQSNQLVADTRNKISAVEKMVRGIAEKIGSLSQYAGFLMEGGKRVLSYLDHKESGEAGSGSAREKEKKPRKKGEEPTLDEIEEGE